jgi:carboxypeptidase Q
MTDLRPFGSLLALVGIAIWCTPRTTAQESTEAIDKRIFQEIRDHNEIMRNLEYLSDIIGPRLTGSDQLQRSVEWASELARRYGLENVHLEEWKVAHSWHRGSARGRILKPILKDLTIASAGWSSGTTGDVHGNIVYVSAQNAEGLEKYRGKLRGSIVLVQQPFDLNWQANPPPAAPVPPIQTPEPAPDRNKVSPEAQFDLARERFFKEQGVTAVLRDSDKSYGLLTMTNAGREYEPAPVPVAMLTHEDYALIWRLMQHAPVELELSLTNSFSEGPVLAYNTVAQIRGSENPDELVIICAHLDSWDLGSGATDDGTGVAAVLEALRAIKAVGLRPRRTIRMVLFTGEEQGQVGSREYVKQHQSELDKISAVLADDSGTGRVSTIRLNQNFAAHKLVDTVMAPMTDLNLAEPGMDRYYGSDYASFNEVGVPGFATSGTQTDYYRTHHSAADTFDKIREEGVVQAAQVLAGWAYNAAELPELLPREPSISILPAH